MVSKALTILCCRARCLLKVLQGVSAARTTSFPHVWYRELPFLSCIDEGDRSQRLHLQRSVMLHIMQVLSATLRASPEQCTCVQFTQSYLCYYPVLKYFRTTVRDTGLRRTVCQIRTSADDELFILSGSTETISEKLSGCPSEVHRTAR